MKIDKENYSEFETHKINGQLFFKRDLALLNSILGKMTILSTKSKEVLKDGFCGVNALVILLAHEIIFVRKYDITYLLGLNF